MEKELCKTVLKMEDLDKTEMYEGVELETYKVYANKLLDLARQAKINKDSLNIVHTREVAEYHQG